ncbi:MAG: ABC transporter ATP-binding protein [Flavobacteriaceae bacterium]|nr:ABC transporter ATP-binding protein [Flavobacteriaceae bacterium]
MKEEINNPIHLRPRFRIELQENHQTVIQKFKEALEHEKRYPSKFVDGHIVIDVPKEKEHFWSPQLNLEVEKIDEQNCLLKGLFGPKPQVWTLFMFVHFAAAIAFMVFATMLYVKWSLDESIVFALIMTIFLPILWVVLYVFGRIGKSTGHAQMDELHKVMERILE